MMNWPNFTKKGFEHFIRFKLFLFTWNAKELKAFYLFDYWLSIQKR